MGVLKIAAIVLFALAGGAFLFSWIYFFSKNVAADIRFLRKIDENAESGEHRDFSGVSFAKAFEQEKTPSKRNTSSGKEIVAASLTVDEGELEEIVPAVNGRVVAVTGKQGKEVAKGEIVAFVQE